MIVSLTGTVATVRDGYAVLLVHGVGYRLNMSTASLSALPAVGDEVTVHTHLHVREDEMTLFGFESESEQAAFERLITVSGVGPKVALSTLSSLDPSALAAAVEAEDVATISGVPGIGKKTAQRIILDLKGKLAGSGDSGATPSGNAAGGEALQALLAMGISSAEASVALQGYRGDTGDVQGLVRHALRRLGGAS